MDTAAVRSALLAASAPRGAASRVLAIADWRFALQGLDEPLAAALDRRWGGFVTAGDGSPDPTLTVRIRRAPRPFIVPAAGEYYRVECRLADGAALVRSYNFAALREDPGRWRAAIADAEGERVDRTVENLLRYLVARTAVERGGLALHGAGVLRDGRVHLFAGKSGSGKTTAVGLSAPCRSLGDDFALTVPRNGADWSVAAVPFDNRELPPDDAPAGWLPLTAIWRLHKAASARIERPPAVLARASLMACVAFAWALPDLDQALLDQVEAFVATGRFAHLHFRRDPDFWQRIDEVQSPV